MYVNTLIGFFKVNAEQCAFELNQLGTFLDSALVSSRVEKQKKKPQSSRHLVGQVLALNQMRMADGEFG